MLLLFPHLLDYQFFVPTLLRAVAGLFFAYIAFRMLVTRAEITEAEVIIVGHIRMWMVWISAFVTLLVGVLLFVGLWTQGAAIVGMLITLKHGLGVKKYSAILPLSGGAYILLFVICTSLLFSGAGAVAFDLPL
ncbi:MAG TPA: hypothetical protein VMH91_00840 [Candidatus Paceibacterota bacterium]|nr:hypothetical protein [Candidatus Paceibacterota bacterium]